MNSDFNVLQLHDNYTGGTAQWHVYSISQEQLEWNVGTNNICLKAVLVWYSLQRNFSHETVNEASTHRYSSE